MYTPVLVGPAIEEGQRLLERLAQERFPISAALWYRVPDTSRWTLVIASPLVARKGQMAAYTRLQAILSSLNLAHLSLSDCSLFSPSSPEFNRVRSSIGQSNRFGIGAVTGPPRNLSSFEDAYVYRW